MGLTSKTTEEKPMKKIFFTILSLMILSLSASSLYARGMGKGMGAGDCGGPGMGMNRPFQHLEMLQDRLDLTNAQVDKIYKIDKEYMDKFYQNRKDDDKIKDLREKHLAEVESVFTAEQKVKWNDFKKDHPMNGKGMNRNKNQDRDCRAFGKGGGMFQKDLGLSDEQIDKIHKIHRDNMDKFYQNRKDSDKLKELRTKQDAEIKNVLTAEQKTKWKELRKNRPVHDKNRGDGKGHYMMWDDYDDED